MHYWWLWYPTLGTTSTIAIPHRGRKLRNGVTAMPASQPWHVVPINNPVAGAGGAGGVDAIGPQIESSRANVYLNNSTPVSFVLPAQKSPVTCAA